MRPFGEPEKVAFEPLTNCFVDKKEAAENRSNEFWGELEESLQAKVGKVYDPHYSRNLIKKEILDYLKRSTAALSNGTEKGISLWAWSDESVWENIKFIVAFDMDYEYLEEDDEVEDGFMESDSLDDEAGFRYDVIKECNSYILEGAALCKRIDSPAYDTWIEAMITLNDRYEGATPYKAVDLIAKAHPRTWADLCTWIHRNQAHKSKKTVKKAAKRKK